MAAVNFESLFNTLKAGVKKIAEQNVKECISDGISNGYSIIFELKGQMQIWSEQMAEGKLSKEDFEWNLKSAMDVVDMVALKQAGLAEIQLDKFKKAMVDLIVTTLESIIP